MTRHAIPFAGVTVAAHVTGSGPPVLLAHNAGNDHHNWDPQIAALARRHTVVAVDLAGYGASEAPEAVPTLSLFAEQLRATLDALELPTVALVGHCVGGAACWELARRHPDRVRSLALFSPATRAAMRAGPYGVLHRLATTSSWGDRLATRLARGTLAVPSLRRLSVRLQLADPPPDRAFLDHCDQLYRRPSNLVALRRLLLAFDSFGSLDEAAARPRVPTLLAWGTHNRILPFRSSASVRAVLQPERFEALHGAGHLVMRGRPDQTTSLLSEWLAEPATP